jgi:hypothetical protein
VIIVHLFNLAAPEALRRRLHELQHIGSTSYPEMTSGGE